MSKSTPSDKRQPNRRTALLIGLAALLIGGGALAYYFSTQPSDELEIAAAQQTSAGGQPDSELMQPGTLPDNVLGSPDAPVTVVEYSSMTCPHCARFHTDVLPALKEEYIDTGKVKYIIREFPLDDLAAAASMLARCIDRNRYFAFIDVLYAKQRDWAFGEGEPVDRLFDVAKQAGFTRESFNQCLSDQKLLDNIRAVRNRGGEEFNVSSTPTFFVNGQPLKGVQSVEDFEKLMPPEVVKKNS